MIEYTEFSETSLNFPSSLAEAEVMWLVLANGLWVEEACVTPGWGTEVSVSFLHLSLPPSSMTLEASLPDGVATRQKKDLLFHTIFYMSDK